ncbi:peptidylprolyl isomerase [candidate division WOR-3 bacterium]|nr:peptidylprolyl isomerase [candidate division WOR-3 bacterium]
MRLPCPIMWRYLIILIIPAILFSKTDRIIGVVDKEAITLSEIEQKLNLTGLPVTQESKEQMLESIIQTKLLLIAAEEETLSVSDQAVEDALSNTINSLKENFPSPDAFYSELQRLGITEDVLREYYRDDVESNLIVRALIQKKFGILSTSDITALHYYETYPESIPDIPTVARYSSVFLPIIPGEKTLKEKEVLIEKVNSKILAGEDFSELAMTYSEDPITRQRGGSLGTVDIDDLDPLFRQEIENMSAGEIRLIQTLGAVHLLRCDMKMGNRVSLRSIIFILTPTKEDSLRVLSFASQIKDSIELGKVPERDERIITISDGSGYLPIPPFFEDIPIGGETKIIEHEDGIYVAKIYDKKESRHPSFEEVKEDLKNLLSQRKTIEKLNYLLSRLEEEIYVERRL